MDSMNAMYIRWGWMLLLGCIIGQLQGQDVSYTQFLTNPIYLNPSLSGNYNGSYRLSGNYRDYWTGNVDNSLRSFAMSGDMKFELKNQFQAFNDIASFGFVFQTDRVALFDYNKNNIALVGAYQKALGSYNPQYIGIGVTFGVIQKSISYEDISFSDQFDAISSYVLPTGESLPQNNVAGMDLGIGLSYSIQYDEARYDVGITYSHLNRVNQSFYKNDPNTNPDLVKSDKLFSKWTLHASLDKKFNRFYSFQPRLVLHVQGIHQSAMIGSNFRLPIAAARHRYFHVGAYVHGAHAGEAYQIPAVSFSTGLEMQAFTVGLSYDFGITNTLTNHKGLNTLELSFQYFGDVDNTDAFYPKF